MHHSSLALGSLPKGTKIGRAAVFPGGPVLEGVPLYPDGRPFGATSGEQFGRPVMFYVPGGGVLQFPDGLAKRFRQQDYFAWGLHLISPGRPGKVRVQIALWYAAYGHYDNSSANPHNPAPDAEVKFGPQGTDEMFIPFLEVSVDKQDLDLEKLRQQFP